MKIYTRGGDRGKTALIGGERRLKSDHRIEAYGSVDEAGAFIGFAVSMMTEESLADIAAVLVDVSQTLWDVGADLAAPQSATNYIFRTSEDAAAKLEPLIDDYKVQADEVKRFILRGGHRVAAAIQVACTVVRRAERRAVALMDEEDVPPQVVRYLNRLSDLLFVLARTVNARMHQAEITYHNSTDVFR